MKLIMMFLFGLTLIVSAKDEEAKKNAELDQLKSSYQAQLKAAMEPINKKYLAQLDALKKKLGGQGDLEGAQLVQKEIDAFAVKPENVKPVDSNVKNLIGKWNVKAAKGYNSVWTFEEDGKVTGIDNRAGTWELKKDKIEILWERGWKDAFTLPIKPSGIKGDSGAGPGTISAKKIEEIGEPKDPKK